MLLSYTAHVRQKGSKLDAFVYGLPVRHRIEFEADESYEKALFRILGELSKEMNAYLARLIKIKAPIPMPYRQPVIDQDYDLPVSLEIAFVMILKTFRSAIAQKDIAKKLNVNPSYISEVERLDTGVSLAKASEILEQLGVAAALDMIPYRDNLSVPAQYSTNTASKDDFKAERLPIAYFADISECPEKDFEKLDPIKYASYLKKETGRSILLFPAKIRQIQAIGAKGEIGARAYEITFPHLDAYNLNITVVDHNAERVVARAEHALNYLFQSIGSERKISLLKVRKEYTPPKVFKLNKDYQITINIWLETCNKCFPAEKKEALLYFFRNNSPEEDKDWTDA